MASGIYDSFLQLVRLGIGTSEDANITKGMNWERLKALADNQGLSAIVLDGIDKLNETMIMPLQMKLEWIGEVLQNYEQRYTAYEKAIGSLAGFYNQYGFKMMVLKGYACSLDWPRPEHRPCGDIDVWQFGRQIEADVALGKETGITIDNGHHHHTVFEWKGFSVENHYDFLNINASKSNAGLEPILKDLAQDDNNKVTIDGVEVYLPSPNLNALFLLRHMLNHFAGAGVNLRNLLDWAFFWEKQGEKVDREWLLELLNKYAMMDFFHIINRICIENLGFEKSIFPETQSVKSELKGRVLEEILNPETDKREAHNPHLISRLIFKMRRWRANSWKRQLCYNEGQVAAFVTSVWSHLLKPASI